MRRWYFPQHNGDFRLEQEGDQCILRIADPTLGEEKLLSQFMTVARKKKWTKILLELNGVPSSEGPYRAAKRYQDIRLDARITVAGAALAKILRPEKSTLTAIKYEDGRITTVKGTENDVLEKLAATTALEKAPEAAVTVKRPTPSCPSCVPGAVEPASEVLQTFLTPEQHADWAQHRALVAVGGTTQKRYLIAHRHSTLAQRIGRICYSVDDESVVHFHDWTVPPEEEVLAAKLILEHEEAWLRNEATMLGLPMDRVHDVLKNPFGDYLDGVQDAKIMDFVGGGVIGFVLSKARQF